MITDETRATRWLVQTCNTRVFHAIFVGSVFGSDSFMLKANDFNATKFALKSEMYAVF